MTKTIDIEQAKEEYEKITEDLMLIRDRFLAVSMDYRTYIDPRLKEDYIYELRDNVMYRLNSASFHFNLLLNHIDTIERNIQQVSETYSLPPFIDSYRNEITSLLDSLVYHSISLFDYMSTLIHFVSTKKIENIKWSSLAKTARDKSNPFSSTNISAVIKSVNQSFVDKLYWYRSRLIHDKPDFGSTSYKMTIGKVKSSVDLNFYTGKILSHSFSEFRTLTTDSRITMRYAAFWIMRRNIETVNILLFALKTEMESKNKDAIPFSIYRDPNTGKEYPSSFIYWHADTK